MIAGVQDLSLHSPAPGVSTSRSDDHIKVIVRVRPLNQKEQNTSSNLNDDASAVCVCSDSQTLAVNDGISDLR
jgi:hypothetical protein